MLTDKLKELIFNRLYDDLSHVEIIHYDTSIWFVDRDEQFWYFELNQNGKLWWRYGFFEAFFSLFSLHMEIYKDILSEWVEEVLNCKVNENHWLMGFNEERMKETLKHTVGETRYDNHSHTELVGDVLKHTRLLSDVIFKCKTNHLANIEHNIMTELRDSVNVPKFRKVNEVLNHKVLTTGHDNLRRQLFMEKISEL